MDAYFPVTWDFGDNPGDGIGGPAVADAGAVYVIRDECKAEDWPTEDSEILVIKTTLDEMVANAIDGCISVDDKIAPMHIDACSRLRDALIAAAGRVSTALSA